MSTAATPPPAFATPRVAAGALLTDPTGRVLLVHPTYKPHWDIPGGYVEPGESPHQACLREIREELALTPTRLTHLVTDWAPLDGEGDKILFVFDAGVCTAAELATIRLAPDELVEWRLVSPADLSDYVPDRLVRRIHAAITARTEGRTIYAEHGREVPPR